MHVLSVTAPIFILIILGYAAVASGVLSRDIAAGVGRFVLYCALPALIFQTLSKTEVGAVVEPMFILCYVLASLGAFVTGVLFWRRVAGDGIAATGAKSFGMSVSNSAFIGYALLMQSFKHPPMAAFAMALLVENIVIIPLALSMMEFGVGRDQGFSVLAMWKRLPQRLVANPLMLAILAGLLFSALGIGLPAAVDRSVGLLAQASTGAALVSIGGLLVGISWKGHLPSACGIAVGKLLIHPLLVMLMLYLLPPFDPQLQAAAVVLASAPMVSIYPIIVGQYGQAEMGASAILITTFGAFFSISAILYFVI